VSGQLHALADLPQGKSPWYPLDRRLTTASRPALGLNQPPIQWVPGALPLEVKWLGLEADNSLPSSAKIKNACSYTSTPAFMAWCSVKKSRETILP